MTPSRPYLLRALHEWIQDNDCTPYVLVDAGLPGVIVPTDYVDDGQIVLNISSSAVRSLVMNGDGLSFNARFGGVPMDVFVPLVAIMAIYAKENGQGMVFGNEAGAPDPNDPQPMKPSKPKLSSVDTSGSGSKRDKKPSLKVIK